MSTSALGTNLQASSKRGVPVFSRIAVQFAHPSPSPLHTTGTPRLLPRATISPNRSHSAATLLRISLVRQWTVNARTPVRRIREARCSVDGWSGRRRILHETGREVDVSRARRMERRRVGVERRAAPMPEWTLWRERGLGLFQRRAERAYENGLGQPQFRSLFLQSAQYHSRSVERLTTRRHPVRPSWPPSPPTRDPRFQSGR